jgi:hypothetical protein
MSDIWYFADQGGQQGPVNKQDLMAALSRMPNAPDVFVWQPNIRIGSAPATLPS